MRYSIRKLTVVVDVDDTCVGLVDEWLVKYNALANDDLRKEEISSFDIKKCFKPEFAEEGMALMYQPSIYDNVKAFPAALSAIALMRQRGTRIVYATHSAQGTEGRKFTLLNDLGFDVAKEDYVEIADKSLLHCDLFVDDKAQTFDKMREVWPDTISILYTQPWNAFHPTKFRGNWMTVISAYNHLRQLRDNMN